MMLFWFAVVLICCVMISFRFARSDVISSRFGSPFAFRSDGRA